MYFVTVINRKESMCSVYDSKTDKVMRIKLETLVEILKRDNDCVENIKLNDSGDKLCGKTDDINKIYYTGKRCGVAVKKITDTNGVIIRYKFVFNDGTIAEYGTIKSMDIVSRYSIQNLDIIDGLLSDEKYKLYTEVDKNSEVKKEYSDEEIEYYMNIGYNYNIITDKHIYHLRLNDLSKRVMNELESNLGYKVTVSIIDESPVMYSVNEFEVLKDKVGRKYLHYSGSETDGSKIHIPINVVSYYRMFENSKIIKTTKIPNTVIDIESAFHNCDELSEFPIIPNKVFNCAHAFDGCTSLNGKVDIPESVITCSAMLKQCIMIKEPMNIPNGVTNCNSMYAGCISLRHAGLIPDSAVFCNNMYDECINLIEAPAIPYGVKECNSMFEECIKLHKTYTIPKTVEQCSRMFYNCKELCEAPKLSDGMKQAVSMFYGCIKLKECPNIPNGTVDCASMFSGCISIIEATEIPDSVIDCGSMYADCVALEEPAVIPYGVIV